MAFSHRDHRARRELRRLYLGFGGCVGGLTLLAVVFPDATFRLLAVAGLALSGVAYVILAERLTEAYRRDLLAVRAGRAVSGSVRAEVYHEVGFERDREDDWFPSPHHRPSDLPSEPGPHPPPEAVPASTIPERWDPPSDES